MTVELIKRTSRARYLHTAAKLTAKENHLAQLMITTQGGTFKITPELIAFLSVETLGDRVIILDVYDNPVSVDREQLLRDAIAQYHVVMESWARTVAQINNSR